MTALPTSSRPFAAPRSDAVARGAAVLVFAVTMAMVCTLLFDYQIVWSQPEMFHYRGHIINYSESEVRLLLAAFDWDAMENHAPRLTRVLSNIGEIADVYFHRAFFAAVFPHPSISLTWLFTLVLSPIVLYRALALAGLAAPFRWLGLSVYASSAGYLSSLTMGFRFGKPVAAFFLILMFYFALKLREDTRARHLIAAAIAFALSLFLDEIAVFGLVIVLAVAITDLRRQWRLPAVLAAILAAHFVFSRLALPDVYAAAGYPVSETYRHEQRFFQLILLQAPGDAYVRLLVHTLENFAIIVADLSSLAALIDPFPRAGAATPVALAGLCLAALRLPRGSEPAVAASPVAGPRLYAGLFVAAVACHSLLMHVTPHPVWTVYWYGAFIGLPWAVLVATALQAPLAARQHGVLVASAIVMTLAIGSTYVFKATNYAVKDFHYHPARAQELSRMFGWEVNKFELMRVRAYNYPLEDLTRDFLAHHRAQDIPAELRYLTLEAPR